MSSHKRRRSAEEKDEGRPVAGRASVGGDGEEKEKESRDQTAAAAIRMESDGDEGGSAAAAAASPSSSSRLIPPRVDLPECDLCRLPLRSADGVGSSEGGGRLPRLLPCGHCYCSKCIEMLLQRSDNVVSCPQRCAFEQELRVDSVLKLPKNFALMKLIEQTAARSALVELGAPPCSHCDPDQPRRAAATFCEECRSYLCKEHDQLLHAAPAFALHQRMSLTVKAQQLQDEAKPDRLLEEAAEPIKEELEDSRKQLKDVDAESQQLIQSLPQSQSSINCCANGEYRQHNDTHAAMVAKLRQTADELERGFLQQKELLEAGHRDLVERQPQIAPLLGTVDALLQGSDLDIATRGDQVQQQCDQMLNQLAATKVQAQPGDVPSTDWLFGLQLLRLSSAILQPRHVADMCRLFKGISLESARLLYRASRDGFKANDFWQRCAGKGPTLTIVKVAGNGFVCGAYTPVSWPADAATRIGYLPDPSGRTFLFSLVNAHGRAVKLRLTDGQHHNALNLNGAAWGPGFGYGADLRLMYHDEANGRDGTFPYSFEQDVDSERAAGLPPIPFAYDKTLLAGDRGARAGYSCAYFAAAEIEVYQL